MIKPGNYSNPESFVKAVNNDMARIDAIVDKSIMEEVKRLESIKLTTGSYPERRESVMKIDRLMGSPFTYDEQADLIFGWRGIEEIFERWEDEAEAYFTVPASGRPS